MWLLEAPVRKMILQMHTIVLESVKPGMDSECESTLARRARTGRAPVVPGKVFPRLSVAPRVGVKDSHSSVWPFEWSVMHSRGILGF